MPLSQNDKLDLGRNPSRKGIRTMMSKYKYDTYARQELAKFAGINYEVYTPVPPPISPPMPMGINNPGCPLSFACLAIIFLVEFGARVFGS